MGRREKTLLCDAGQAPSILRASLFLGREEGPSGLHRRASLRMKWGICDQTLVSCRMASWGGTMPQLGSAWPRKPRMGRGLELSSNYGTGETASLTS